MPRIKLYAVFARYRARHDNWPEATVWHLTNKADANNLAAFLLEHPRITSVSVYPVRKEPALAIAVPRRNGRKLAAELRAMVEAMRDQQND